MFIENAKTYIQLASAGLVLTVAFMREIGHIDPKQKIVPTGWMVATWIAFLIAIGAGAFYQYLAVKYIKRHLPSQTFQGWDWLARECGKVYGVMLVTFYVGAIFFTIHAITNLG